MIIGFLNFCNSLNENLFSVIDKTIECLPFADWLIDAISDSIHIIPILFIVFLLIEAIEYFYSDKINELIKKSEKATVIVGSSLAIIPQCGFSIIASSLYQKRYITKGTLIAIYLATSDETIPILLTQPTQIHYIIPIISIKLFIAILAGYIIDLIFKDKYVPIEEAVEKETGCCHHSISEKHLKELIIHPIKHTLSIFLFILFITILLNFFINLNSPPPQLENIVIHLKGIAPIITGLIGLIPNCAISISFTMLLIDGTLKFSTVMAGLLSNAGLGILVLLKQKENYKDSFKIIILLLLISILTGFILQMFNL